MKTKKMPRRSGLVIFLLLGCMLFLLLSLFVSQTWEAASLLVTQRRMFSDLRKNDLPNTMGVVSPCEVIPEAPQKLQPKKSPEAEDSR